MVKLESHCHSLYSHDSEMKIKDIVCKCMQNEINAIIICDHDVCKIKSDDINLFQMANIKLFKAIEFTTDIGVHIIGVSENIKLIEKNRGYYSLTELIEQLHKIKALIIIPHPDHETGLFGNKKATQEEVKVVLKEADYIEIDNYKYGRVFNYESILNLYKNLGYLAGSDAHGVNNVGAYLNVIDINKKCEFNLADLKNNVMIYKRKKHSKWYWKKNNLKKTKVYQLLLLLIPLEIRKRIKKTLFNH